MFNYGAIHSQRTIQSSLHMKEQDNNSDSTPEIDQQEQQEQQQQQDNNKKQCLQIQQRTREQVVTCPDIRGHMRTMNIKEAILCSKWYKLTTGVELTRAKRYSKTASQQKLTSTIGRYYYQRYKLSPTRSRHKTQTNKTKVPAMSAMSHLRRSSSAASAAVGFRP